MDDRRGKLAAERTSTTQLPRIDLSPFVAGGGIDARRATARALRAASMDIGFFYLEGHGIPEREFAEVAAMSHRFFELPLAEKMALHMKKSPARLGYAGLGGPDPEANPDKIPDLVERFHMTRDLLPGEPEDGRRGAGMSQWPADSVLPGFAATMRAHFDHRCTVTRQLARAFAMSLDLPETHFEEMYRYLGGQMVVNYYPPVDRAKLRDKQWSFSPHSDYNGFTLLWQDEMGGLEVRTRSDGWIDVPPVPGTMIVNVGDLFQMWTNDLYTSSLHRAINKGSAARISIALFASPQGATTIRCLDTCAGPGNPPKYPPIRAEQFLEDMLAQAYQTGLPAISAKTAERLRT
jgi:isopenicillin N synthase-like dioxygenase